LFPEFRPALSVVPEGNFLNHCSDSRWVSVFSESSPVFPLHPISAEKQTGQLTVGTFIGTPQGIAVAPGISRLGVTTGTAIIPVIHRLYWFD
jgi:hypothetical protein